MSTENPPPITIKITGFCKSCNKHTELATAHLCKSCHDESIEKQLKRFKKDFYEAFNREYVDQ